MDGANNKEDIYGAPTGWTTTWVSEGIGSASTVTDNAEGSEEEQDKDKTHQSTDEKVAMEEDVPAAVVQSGENVGETSKIEDQSSFGGSPASLNSLDAERRPKPTARQEERTEEVPPLQPLQSEEEDGCPSNWATDGWSGPDGFYLIKLRTHVIDYRSIIAEFAKQVEDYSIVQIERLENRDLWDKYLFEKTRMLRSRPPGADLNECYLYHGTTVEKEIIASEGLDMRKGKIGFFGRGIYLSDNINKCLQYTSKRTEKSNLPYILKCRVLLGDSKVYENKQTNKDLVREPIRENPKPGESKYYDSVKGNVLGHDEYVVYHNVRVMPEYIVTYREKSAQPSPGNSIKLNTGLSRPKSKPPPPTSNVESSNTTAPALQKPQSSLTGNAESTQSRKPAAVSQVDHGRQRQTVAGASTQHDEDSRWRAVSSSASPWRVGMATEPQDTGKEQLSNEFAQSIKTDTRAAGASSWRGKTEEVSQEVWTTQKEEISNELKENIEADAAWRGNPDELSQEVSQGEYSEELRMNEQAVAEMEQEKDRSEVAVKGQLLSWGPQNPEQHDKKLEAVRTKLQKKHRRFKDYKKPPPESQAASDAAKSHDEQIEEIRQIMKDKNKKDNQAATTPKPTGADVQKDSGDDGQAVRDSTKVADKQALQIREYLKQQHKTLQLRRADEESIGKVESLLVAYYQTYGSIDAPGIDPSAIPSLPLIDTTDTQGGLDEQKQDDPQQDTGLLARGQLSGSELNQSNNNTITGQKAGVVVEEDPVNQVMNVLVVQFKECTGVTDDAIAVSYIKKADMDISEAILRYLS